MNLSSGMIWRYWLRGILIALVLVSRRVWGGGEEVVVVYVNNSPESKGVAEYYAAKRSVPTNQLIGLDLPVGDALTRSDFERLVELPLISLLQERGLCRFETSIVAAADDFPAHTRYRCVESKVRYLMLTWGFPYHIYNDPNLKEKGSDKLPPNFQINEASVDSDLSLLPAKGYYPLFGCYQNFAYGTTNAAIIHPTNGIFAVTRLDGPSPEIARGLVDKALAAETNGLGGHAYIDERGIKEGAYAIGDQWMTNAAHVTRLAGYSTYIDHLPETFPASFPLSQIAIYAGWYGGYPTGPFTNTPVEFLPGAIAYHLHSFSAANLRSPTQNWVGPLLQMGATVTMGCVAEPYLHLTPEPHRLLERMIFGQFTFGEASITCQFQLSWQNVFIGDPLYRPFGRSVEAIEADLRKRNDVHIEWAILRKINTYLINERPRGALIKDLLTFPLSTNSAVLAEKVALLQAEAIEFRSAIEWGQRALRLSTSPNQRLRLLLNIAEWQSTVDRPEAAYATLREVEELRVDYREMIPFRQKQLNLAREAKLKPEIDRILAELNRMKSPTESAPGTKN